MWRFVAPALERKIRTVFFDGNGGGTRLLLYREDGNLHGYANDVVELGARSEHKG